MMATDLRWAAALTDVLFVFEGITWLKWLVGTCFFLLGLFAGWWRWGFRAAGSAADRPLRKPADPREGSAASPLLDLLAGETGPTRRAPDARGGERPPRLPSGGTTPPATSESRRGAAIPEQAPAAAGGAKAGELGFTNRFGEVLTERPRDCDALLEVRGIGMITERRLNRLGIYRFRQLAALDAAQAAALATELGIERSEVRSWSAQARELA